MACSLAGSAVVFLLTPSLSGYGESVVVENTPHSLHPHAYHRRHYLMGRWLLALRRLVLRLLALRRLVLSLLALEIWCGHLSHMSCE